MTPFFVFFIGIMMIGLARFVRYFGAPAPFGMVVAAVGLLLVIVAVVSLTFESKR